MNAPQLSREQALEILRRCQEVGVSQRSLAGEYGLRPKSISRAVKRALGHTGSEEPPKAPTRAAILEQAAAAETLDEARQAVKDARSSEAERYRLRRLKHELEEFDRWESFGELVRDAVKALPVPDVAPPANVAPQEAAPVEPVICVGDAQIGEHVLPEYTGGMGGYGFSEFQIRWRRYVHHVQRIFAVQRQANPITRAHMPFIGDNLDGDDIYKGHAWHLDLDLIDQMVLGSQEEALMAAQVSTLVEQLHIYGVLGNHGRIGKKGERPRHVNLDWMIYHLMQLHLKDYKNIVWHVDKTPWQTAEIQGWGFVFSHGDSFKSWNSIPFYGAERESRRWAGMLSARKFYPNYYVYGHHHQHAQADTPGGEWLMNGTFVGGSDFSINELRVSGRPSQLVFGVHPERGIDWRYKVLLDVPTPGDEIPAA